VEDGLVSFSDEQFAALADGMDVYVEAAKGFRQKMIDAGFSAAAADEAAVAFLQMLLRGTPVGSGA
jgi:hypothetical protein